MPNQMRLLVQGAGLDPSSIQRIEAQKTQVTGNVEEFSIGEIAGNAKLRSRLQEGSVSVDFGLVFHPHIDWGMVEGEAEDRKRTLDRLKQLGLTSDQANGVMNLIESNIMVEPLTDPTLDTTLPGWSARNDEGSTVPPATTGRGVKFAIPLPNFPVNLDPQVDIKDISIKNIHLSETTTIASDNPDLSGLAIDDFEVMTPSPDPVSVDKAEIAGLRMSPKEIPSFTLSNLETHVTIPRLGSSEIPLDIETKSGSADINLTLLDWHPRWNWGACIKILWKKVCIGIEFGFDFRIVLHYKWVLSLLSVSLKIRDAFLKQVHIGVKVGRLVFTKMRIGLLKLGRLLFTKA